jgi:hypothetical protein
VCFACASPCGLPGLGLASRQQDVISSLDIGAAYAANLGEFSLLGQLSSKERLAGYPVRIYLPQGAILPLKIVMA